MLRAVTGRYECRLSITVVSHTTKLMLKISITRIPIARTPTIKEWLVANEREIGKYAY